MGTLVEKVLEKVVVPLIGVVVDRVFPSGETRESQSYECTPVPEIEWKDMERILRGANPPQLRTVSEMPIQA